MNLMRAFSIRLDDELFQKLESSRGENPRADYIREVLISHFQEHKNKANLGEPSANRQENLNEPIVKLIKENEALKVELTHKEEINKIMDARVKDLQDQNGFLVSEYSKLSRLNEQLLLSPAPEEIVKKSWCSSGKNEYLLLLNPFFYARSPVQFYPQKQHPSVS